MKIKKVIILLVSLILILKISSLSQQKIKERYIYYPDIEQTFIIYKLQNGVTIDTSNIIGMTALMDTGQISYSIAASYFLVERGHTEISPNLKSLYYLTFGKNEETFYYLQALYLLKDPDVPSMLSAYVDSMLVFRQTRRSFNNWGMSVAIEKLRKYNNYTKFGALKSFFNYDTGELPSHETLYFYGKQEVYRDSIYNRLVPFITHPNEATRSSAISSFGGIYWNSTEAQEILRQAALNDSSEKNRLWAIYNLDKRHNDPVMLRVCEPIAKYTADTNSFHRALFFISFQNSPYSLLALKNIMNTRTPNTYFYDYVKHDFKIYQPDRPPDSVSIFQMIDTVYRNINEVVALDWFGNQAFVNELNVVLSSARNYLLSGDSLNCARQIFTFQKKVNEEYRDSLDGDNNFVTIEGWKFLYYNAQYILDRLPGSLSINSSVSMGWNMVSVPVHLLNFQKSTVYPTATSNAFMYYAGYVRKDTLENGIGYWLKFGSNDTIKYKGFPIEIDTIDVAAGWNMIGSISSNINCSKIKAESTEIVSPFFGFQNGYVADTTIIPGKAYWVKVSQAGNIILDKYATAADGQPPSETPPPPPGSPDIPNLYSPNNGSTGISKTPTLIWFSSIKAQTYRLQVSTNSTFTNLVFDDSTLTTTSKQIGTLANSTTYYWRVNAKNAVWTSDWSGVFWFRTLGIPPPPDPCQPIDAFSALDQFTVSDLNGNKQQLFAHNGGRRLALGLKDYDMPPEPIEDVFHAKFQSGRFVESVPPGKGISKIPIKIKDANFPITINWNIRPESNTKYWLYKSGRDKILLSGVGSTTINSIEGNMLLIEAQAISPEPCY
jgi:hypothetical protein